MVQTEQPLYPKLSSIYNKIMQLAIAIVLIVAVMNILLLSDSKTKAAVNQYFISISQDYTQNVADTIAVLLMTKRGAKKSVRYNKVLKQYLQNLPKAGLIYDVHFYDQSGQLKMSSENSLSMAELYGLSEHKINRSAELIPFVSEIRTGKQNKLQGYVRLTLKKSHLITPLLNNNNENQQFTRLMLILAGLIGFLLTRGLNRFSRQGYRVARN